MITRRNNWHGSPIRATMLFFFRALFDSIYSMRPRPRSPSTTSARGSNPPFAFFVAVGGRNILVRAKVPDARAVLALLLPGAPRRAAGRNGGTRMPSRDSGRRRQHRHRDSNRPCRPKGHSSAGSSGRTAATSLPATSVRTLNTAVIVLFLAAAVGLVALFSGAAAGYAATIYVVGGDRFHNGFIL